MFGSSCFTHICNFTWQLSPKWIQHEVFWKLPFRKGVKTEKCVWTAPACTHCIWAYPLERSRQPKIEEKKGHISEALILAKDVNIFGKRAPKGLQKGDGISGQTLLGPPLEPQADFWFKKWAHSAPKVPPGTQTCFKNDPKRAKNDPKSDSESVFIGDFYTGPQIWTEARRTARSALNKCSHQIDREWENT